VYRNDPICHRRFTSFEEALILKDMKTIRFAWVAIAIALVGFPGCGKLSDAQKQDASNIVGGMAGDTGSSLSTSAGLVAPTTLPSSIGTFLRDHVQGILWLTHFRALSGPTADLTLNTTICGTGVGEGSCSGKCNSAKTIFTETCTLPDGATTCSGTSYTFSSASASVTADFTNTGGSVGAASGTFVVGFSITGTVTGGSLDGKELECSMNFTVDIEALKNGTLKHFSPSCDSSFSCKYDGKDIGCADIQTDMGTSTLSCSP
jgi:hypothetical protein